VFKLVKMQTDLGNKGREAPQSELQQVKCILHIGKETGSEKVKLFTVQMLENCREKSLVYKFREKSEYATIIIPASADNNTGYHSSCYRKFTAVSAKELKAAKEKQGSLDEQSVSSAGSNINQTESGNY
jgi:hypothetical protein